MLKRTKGRILLTLLVVTGLAGTVNNTGLSNQERKRVIGQLKESRTNLLNTIKGLSDSQLDFRPSPARQSIRECFYQLVANEKTLWAKLDAAIKKPATPEKRALLISNDDNSLPGMINPDEPANIHSEKVRWKSMAEAVSTFKFNRIQQLKYVKTTTADLRNRLIKTPQGWVDCYQFITYISAYSYSKLQQIQEIMSTPAYPSR